LITAQRRSRAYAVAKRRSNQVYALLPWYRGVAVMLGKLRDRSWFAHRGECWMCCKGHRPKATRNRHARRAARRDPELMAEMEN
jgi:hypothetical protein